MRFLLLIPIVLVAGYVIARNHHRLRDLGIGITGGAALPPLPDLGDDHGNGHAGDHDHHDHHDYHGGADSSHVDPGHRGY